MNIHSILLRACDLFGGNLAVVEGARRLTYAEVGRRVGALARHLAARGVARGDRVAVLDHNGVAFFEAYFAAAALGAVLCPINHRLSAGEVAFILGDAGARLVLCRGGLAPLLAGALDRGAALDGVVWVGEPALAGRSWSDAASYEEVVAPGGQAMAPARVAGSDLAHLYYTSGTTGRPKGVMLTHDNVCVHALAAVAELSLGDRDVWGHVAPMFHLADAWATFAVTWVGGRHVMSPAFEAEAALALLDREGVTVSNLIPTMLNLMLKHPGRDAYPCRAFRLVLSGGAPIAPDLVRRIMAHFGCEYVQTYGMTETSPYLTLSTLKAHLRRLPAEQQFGFRARTGRPFLTVELRVEDAAGREVARDGRQVGEILARGPTVTPGYWNLPEDTRAAFTADGFLRTGDLATVDPEGYLEIVDRKKDMIICGGENIYSIEVENALYGHPAVLEAAVFGLPHETWGEQVTAAVVLRPGREATEAGLQEFCRGLLAGYKVPRRVTFLDALPRTGSGKIQKRALRERLGG